MSPVKKILKALDVGRGVRIVPHKCRLHGDTFAVQIFNKGGKNSTRTCLACATELKAALPSQA